MRGCLEPTERISRSALWPLGVDGALFDAHLGPHPTSADGAGLYGSSKRGEGLFAMTQADDKAAVAAVNTSTANTASAVYAKKAGELGHGKRRTTDMKKGMKESYIEDPASHGGPDHALATREGAAKRYAEGRESRPGNARPDRKALARLI